MGTPPLSVSFTLLLSWLCMKEAICLLPVISDCQSFGDTLHFERVHQPASHPPPPSHTGGNRADIECSSSSAFSTSAHSELPFPSVVMEQPLSSPQKCCCAVLLLAFCAVTECFSFSCTRIICQHSRQPLNLKRL